MPKEYSYKEIQTSTGHFTSTSLYTVAKEGSKDSNLESKTTIYVSDEY